MNLKKALFVLFTLSLIITATTGCSTKGSKEKSEPTLTKEKKVLIDDLGKEKVTNHIKINLVKGEYATDSGIADDQDLVVLSFEIDNENYLEEVGVGAGDFQIFSDGKTYQMYGEKDNFGEVIKSKGSAKGTGAYLIPANISKVIIRYQPVNPNWPNMEKLEWSFTIK